MPTDSDFKAAVEGKNPALLESALVKRVPYVFAEGENIQDWVSTEDGTTTLAILNSDTRTIFWLDPDDTTSDHDGVSVCVSSDGKRYHATDFRWPTSLLAVGEETPPADSPEPAAGAAYQIGAAPTGDWSSNAGDIAIWTSRGWKFLTPPEGLLFYNVADGLHYFQDENGDFVTISIVPGPDTVRDTAIIGGARRYIVENQDTNDPPTPTTGVYYIVGPSPTGGWAGQTGNIATSYDDATWSFITPTEGVEAYDKAENANFVYNGGWISAAGAWTVVNEVFTAGSGSTSLSGTQDNIFNYGSGTTAPTTSNRRRHDNVGLAHTAARAGTRNLRITYQASFSGSAVDGVGTTLQRGMSIALFRDSETSAIGWQQIVTVSGSSVPDGLITVVFMVDADDTSSHTYTVAMMGGSVDASRVTAAAPTRRLLQIEEKF